MVFQEIKGEDYTVEYEPASQTVHFVGELSLGGPAEYTPIVQLLEDITNQNPPTITLNLKRLQFLNSSGISLISKFIINMRKKKTIQVVVLGSEQVPWQKKSLKNLEKLLPTLKLKIE